MTGTSVNAGAAKDSSSSTPEALLLARNVISDVASTTLIAELLDQDARELASKHISETLQLHKAYDVSCTEPTSLANEKNLMLALRLFADDFRTTSDAALAESLYAQTAGALHADRVLAIQTDAKEKSAAVDAEFARKLGEMEERRETVTDALNAESVLDRAVVRQILSSTYEGVRKGKGKQVQRSIEDDDTPEIPASEPIDRSPELGEETDHEPDQHEILASIIRSPAMTYCGICLESIQLSHSPIDSALRPNCSSRNLDFGLTMPCSGSHVYCDGCLEKYILGRIDPKGDGKGVPNVVVFPISCPECSLSDFPRGIGEDVARRVLSEKNMLLWDQQKTFDALPKLFCPNRRCSQPVQASQEEFQVECASCHEFMCVRCRSPWHIDLSCEQYEALPIDERSPEDRATFRLAKEQKWARCPECRFLVELVAGCYHMRCHCGAQFCFRCGSKWTTKCTSSPSCVTWDERMLYNPQDRREFDNGNEAASIPGVGDEFAIVAAQENGRDLNGADLGWLLNERATVSNQKFTRATIRSLVCGYCKERYTSRGDLRAHLTETGRRLHSVWSCCGRLFPSEAGYNNHRRSGRNHHHHFQRSVR